MESIHKDPITDKPYDLTVHVPHILLCCGETCAITTIQDLKSDTNKCPFCSELLSDAGWPVNKVICQILTAQGESKPKPQGRNNKKTRNNSPPPQPKNICKVHRGQNLSMICIDDNMLLCTKCLSKAGSHVGHQVEDVSECLQNLRTRLTQMKHKTTALRTRCEQTIEEACHEAKTTLQEVLNEQIAESEKILEELPSLETAGRSHPTFSVEDAQDLCEMLDMDIEAAAEALAKEIRAGIIKGLKNRLLSTKEDKKLGQNDEADKVKGDCLKTLQGHSKKVCHLLALPPNQIISASGDKTIKIWDVAAGNCLRTLKGHTGIVFYMQILPSGQLASCSWDKTVRIWDLTNGNCLKVMTGHTDYTRCLQTLPSGHLASGSGDTTIKIWDVATSTCLKTLQGHTKYVFSLQVLPSGELASGSGDSTIKIWNIWNPNTANCVMTLTGHRDGVSCLRMLRPGQLASSSLDRTIKIWDITTAACLKTLEGHTDAVSCLQVIPSGHLVSGSGDNTIKFWNVDTGTCVQTIQGHAARVCCLLLLPAAQMVSGSEDNSIKIWI